MDTSLEKTIERATIKALKRRKRDQMLNLVMHIPLNSTVMAAPIFETFSENRNLGELMYSVLPSGEDPAQISLRLLTGLGVALVGGFIKDINDVSKIDDVIKDKDREIVTDGMYGLVRHPCYLSFFHRLFL